MDSILTQLSRFVLDWRQRLLHSSRAHAWGTKLLRLWVRFPPGAGLFLLFLSPSSASLNRTLKEVQHCLLSFTKIDDKLCSLGQNKHNMHKFGKKCSYVYFRAERIVQANNVRKNLGNSFFQKKKQVFWSERIFWKERKKFWMKFFEFRGRSRNRNSNSWRPAGRKMFPGKTMTWQKKCLNFVS